jgi:hypothetical protein
MLVKKISKIIGFFVCVLSLFAGAHAAEASIGVSPAQKHFDLLLPNTLVEGEIVLSRREFVEDETFKFYRRGPGGDALVFLDGEEIVFPGGEKKMKYRYGLNAGSLPTGEYEAWLQVKEVVPNTAEGTGTSSLQGSSIYITFNVVNFEKEVCEVDTARFISTERGQPVILEYLLRNDGNVQTKPRKIDVLIEDRDNEDIFYEETFVADDLEFGEPFQISTHTLEMDTKLPEGGYTATAVFSGCGEVDFERSESIFILPEGSIDQEGQFISFVTDKDEYLENELVTFTGVFRNTGQVQYKAEMSTSVFQGEDNKVDLLRSEPLLVRPGEEITFESIFRPSDFGEYRGEADIIFGVKRSDKKEAPFRVTETNSFMLALVLSLLTLLLGFILFLLYRKRKSGEEKVPIGAYCEYDPYPEGSYCVYDSGLQESDRSLDT